MEYVSPIDDRVTPPKAFAPRPETLEGARVALLDITKAQGDALKQRIQSDNFPVIGGPGRGFGAFGFFHRLDAAASYIGITEDQLRTELEAAGCRVRSSGDTEVVLALYLRYGDAIEVHLLRFVGCPRQRGRLARADR